MKKKQFFHKLKKLTIVFLMFLAVAFLGMTIKVSAFGDYNDYDYDTGGDWGDWGDSGDWDSGDWGDSGDWNSDYSSDDDIDEGILWVLIHLAIRRPEIGVPLLIIFLIVGVIKKTRKKAERRRDENDAPKNPGMRASSMMPEAATPRRQAPLKAKTMPDRTNEITEIIKETDPLFTTPDFISYVKDVYMDIQDAWCKRDLTPVRAVLHQNLYQRTQKQIDKKIADGIVNHLDRITVNNAYPTFYRRDEEYEYVTVYLVSQMIDYQVKEATGEIIYGDTTTRWTMCYLMTFMRSIDAKTVPAGNKDRGLTCPNCGAPLAGTSFGECAYCGSIVTTGAYDWVLSDFNVSRPETQDEGVVR